MGDSHSLGQLKKQYRARFYQNRVDDLPEIRPGTNVLSAIKDYFNEAGGKVSPDFSRTSFAHNLTNTPDSILKNQGSSSSPRMSTFSRLQSVGKINETKMKASPTVTEKMKTPNNMNINVVSEEEEEMDDCESDMPCNLVIESEKDSEIVRRLSNPIRNRFYSSDDSVVKGPPSPASKSSPQKRLLFSDVAVNNKPSIKDNKASFLSSFASRYKRRSADDDPTKLMPESVKTDSRPDKTALDCANKDDEEFIIEDEHSINMNFLSENKRTSFGSSKITTSMTSSIPEERQKLIVKSNIDVEPEQPLARLKNVQQTRQTISEVELESSNQIVDSICTKLKVPRTTNPKVRRKSSIVPEETQELVAKSNIDVESEQTLAHSKTAQKTKCITTGLELDEIINQVVHASSSKVKIPINTKPKVVRPRSSCVSYQTLEIKQAEPVPEQPNVQSQAIKKTFTDNKRNKAKDTLSKEKSSFSSRLRRITAIDPPITRMDKDYSDHAVLAEDDEFIINDITDLCSDGKTKWNKKLENISKHGKEEKNAQTEALNVTFISARQSDIVKDLRKSQNHSEDSSPLNARKNRLGEVEKLVQRYVPADDNQNEMTTLRPKRTSAPPSAWWVVKKAAKNTTYEIEKENPLPKRKASAESVDLEWQSDEEESFHLNLPDPNEQVLKESKEKSSKSLTHRKIKKRKPLETEKPTVPSNVKRQKKIKAAKKKGLPAKTKKSTKQQELKTEERKDAPENSHKCDLLNETDSLAAAARPTTPPVSRPHYSSQKQTSDEVPRQSLTSPVYKSAMFSFQSGPVLRTRAVEHTESDGVVRNLATAGSLYADVLPPMTIVNNIDTNNDALAECLYLEDVEQDDHSPITVCFNNPYFCAGKCVLKPMEEEVRDVPILDIMVFYIIHGKVQLRLHTSYHYLKRGDSFFIPPGNTFLIKNVGNEDAELIFTQLKPDLQQP